MPFMTAFWFSLKNSILLRDISQEGFSFEQFVIEECISSISPEVLITNSEALPNEESLILISACSKEKLFKYGFYIPCGLANTDKEINYVIKVIKKLFN